MINVNGLKRNAKNIVKKYSDAQVKVREATSNDPWGPSSTIMAEIADLTYNVVAFSEIMQMIWKRLNDHGKNWRHVYKALVVLEYLIKTGTEKVAQQCIENIFAIQTLKDFQYMEENKDYGMNIREKSKKLVALLKDSEKLKAERARAIKAKSRLAESMSSVGKSTLGSLMSSSGSSGSGDTAINNNISTTGGATNGNNYLNYHNDSGSSSSGAHLPDVGALAILGSDLDSARPQTATEEENQLKLALALSKDEAEQQEKTRKNDELRLKLALDVSKKTTSTNLLDDLTAPSTSHQQSTSNSAAGSAVPSTSTAPQNKSNSAIDDLLGLTMPPPEPQNDPWSSDPWPTPAMSFSQTTTVAPPASIMNDFSTLTKAATTTTSTMPNPLTLPTMATSIAPTPAPTTNPGPFLISNNVLNRRPMSKNPFEEF